MQAIILAAGMGKRLKELTKDCTKSMVKVNGITLIERMLRQLDCFCMSKIVVVIGYEGEKLKQFILSLEIKTPVEFIENPIFHKTNNIYSLYLAREYLLNEDTLLLESDLIFEDGLLKKLIDEPGGSLVLVDKFESWMDGSCVTIDEEMNIRQFLSKRDFEFEDIGTYYKTVNIYRFTQAFSRSHYVPFLEAYSKALGDNEYYEQVLKVITLLDKPEIKALPLTGEKWYEIDDAADLNIAESIFAHGKEKLEKIKKRYGGYWRYPGMLDFCYLVNPLFPTAKLISEMKSFFPELLTNYPSGLEVNNLLAAKNFAVNSDYICVGNGASELIKVLMTTLSGKVGVVYPTFEEYPNLIPSERIVAYNLAERPSDSINMNNTGNDEAKSFYNYDEENLMDFFEGKDIETLVLINPDNPSGNLIDEDGIGRLLKWCNRRNVRIVLDESFLDFAHGAMKAGHISNKILEDNKNLVVIKSISKSHGVPGVRLGIMCTSDVELIQRIRKNVSIWNINSFAEFYLQIFEKYQRDFEIAMEGFLTLREEFHRDLRQIAILNVLPSASNFFMCEVKNPHTAIGITEELLDEHDIFIKDLTGKTGIKGQWIRVSIKSAEENKKLVEALKSF